MLNRFSHRITEWLAAAALLAPLPAVSFATIQTGQPPKSNAASPNANQYGELSGLWWQWIFSFPVADNPNFKTGLVDCSFGQSSHSRSNQIWFLGGTFGGATERTCTVPRGIKLFFPLLNFEYDNIGCCDPTTPPFTYKIQEMRQFAAALMDNPLQLYASVDGVPVPAYRAQSQVFSYTVPATDNLYQHFGYSIPGANWPSTTISPGVSDGYWVLVEPLPPGPHTIKFGGITKDGFAADITYHILVTP